MFNDDTNNEEYCVVMVEDAREILEQCELRKNHLSMTKSSMPKNLLNLKSVNDFKSFEAIHIIVININN